MGLSLTICNPARGIPHTHFASALPAYLWVKLFQCFIGFLEREYNVHYSYVFVCLWKSLGTVQIHQMWGGGLV